LQRRLDGEEVWLMSGQWDRLCGQSQKGTQDSLLRANVLRILRGNREDFDTKGMKRKDASDDQR
tara:strand:+ start:4994 stop:5185 length:192 start_codon:yes stop_codon:yes gene_type:complete